MHCGSCPLNRRQFLAGCAAGVGGLATLKLEGAAAAVTQKPKIRVVFSHHRQNEDGKQSEAGWPYLGYDHEGRKQELLARLRQACPEIEFLPATAYDSADAKKILERDAEVEGYLSYMIGGWAGAAETFAATGRPALFVGDLFGASGELLTAYAAARRAHRKVAVVSSSRWEDVGAAARCFALLKEPGGSVDAWLAACDQTRREHTQRAGNLKCAQDAVESIALEDCLKKLRAATILAVGGGWGMPASGQAIEQVFGTKVVPVEFAELKEAGLKVDPAEARRWADQWSAGAAQIVEPTPEDIQNSAALYLAMLDLLKRHNAQAITINCLGGFYGGHMKSYPCLGFCQLNNDGLVGACEGDLDSTITMLAVTSLTGRPGFISDPVIDTAKNQIVYVHCVAPTKVFGRQGPSNPYHLRSHGEDRKGASMRSLMPRDYWVTTLKMDAKRRQVIFHQGKSVANVDDPKSCRTKLAVEVKGDIDKLFGEWDQWGWHRVSFYGDLRRPVEAISQALGLTLVEEA
jgi:L-fucose isomerase-like protein